MKNPVFKAGGISARAVGAALARICCAVLFLSPWPAAGGAREKDVYAQTTPRPASIRVTGTSTLHDWEILGDTITGRLTLDSRESDALGTDTPVSDWTSGVLESVFLTPDALPGVAVTVPVRSLTSGRRVMDREMLNTMKADRHAAVEFALTSMRALSETDGNAGGEADGEPLLRAVAGGVLKIGGQTRAIEFPVAIGVRDGRLRVSGEAALKMTDYGLNPPRLMMGALRVGDEVKVRFDWAPERLIER